MRRYKTACFICGRETRNRGIGKKSIDVCYKCMKDYKLTNQTEIRDLFREIILKNKKEE